MKQLFIIAFFIIAGTVHSFGQETGKKSSPLRFLVGGALELGGDEIAEVYFTNGNKQSVKAGQGGSIAVGGQLQLPGAEQFLLRTTVGFKYVTTAADNVHVRLTRIPVHLTAHWIAGKKIMIGAGYATHRNIKFKTDGLGGDMDFKPAGGPRFELAYSGIGLSYTAMKYADAFGQNYSANAIGLTFMLALPENRK
jgi:hypothetical protein